MSYAPDSVAPPGWTAPSPPAMAPATASPDLVAEAEAAVRWRLRAARIDNFIVYGASVLVCLLAHLSLVAVSSLWVLGVVSVGYHFVLESRGGQTIGKRRYGIRVVSLDGGAPSAKAVAIRSILRIVDQLPISYLSGLISMVRTGPARRQRIGDVAAGTMVIATGRHAAERGTPGWFLPAATIASAVASVLCVLAFAAAGSQTVNSSQQVQSLSRCLSNPAACGR